MTDHKKLRRLAKKAMVEENGGIIYKITHAWSAAANPKVVLELLDEIEALDGQSRYRHEENLKLIRKVSSLLKIEKAARKVEMKYVREDFWPLKEALEEYDA